MTVSSPSRLPTDDVRWVAAQAGRSPSLHNSQPWRLRWDGGWFRLYADSSRRLAVSDPNSRELTISCGAALFSLRAALRQLGRDGDVVRFPDPNQPELLAEVEVLAVARPGSHVRRMPAAFMRRHTHRAGTDGGPLDRTLAWRLLAAAEAEGARLIYITAPGPLRAVLDLAHMTEWSASADPGVQQETRDWTSVPGDERRDGVPATAFTSGHSPGEPDDLAPRDFDLGRHIGTGIPVRGLVGPVAVLVTAEDRPVDWLRAGEALQSVLLTAAEEWTFAQLHSRVTEVRHARAQLRRDIGTLAFPQLLLRFVAARTAVATPRRPVDDFLEVALPG